MWTKGGRDQSAGDHCGGAGGDGVLEKMGVLGKEIPLPANIHRLTRRALKGKKNKNKFQVS